ncbi:hypothetical protein JCM3774_002907 [Rhodotorula dairenensis]
MAKGSGRFRNRKLGFKTRINVEVGVVIEEDPIDVDLDIEDEKGHKAVETGVDKDEEGEVHLQAVIASTAAYVARNASASGRSDKGKKPEASIPTRGSVKISEEEYRTLYEPGYSNPVSYIRFSDTVEDCIKGAYYYTMDEDDEDWLEDFNAQFEAGSKPRPSTSSAATTSEVSTNGAAPAGEDDPTSGTPSGRGARTKGKSVDRTGTPTASTSNGTGLGLEALPAPTSPLSEDDFEFVMELFEMATDRRAPMTHVNLSLLPSLNDFDSDFSDPLKPHLAKLRPYAKEVYPHWRQRRIARGGKPIIPQLDYDESNENNPYVCFRRRDIKTARKTRRSDQQNLERLVRLRNDLYAAHALLVKVQERERIKLESIQLERKVFDERCEMRELKRRLNEPDGDEDLLISRREKKRKRDDQGAGSLRLSVNRKPDALALSPATLVVPLEELQARKQRNDAIIKQIERDLARKRQNDQHWEDWTDSAYVARPPPMPARYWRAVEPVPHTTPYNDPNGRREALGFATQYQPPLGRVRTSFRKRVGRGGRILLDRIGPPRGGEDGDDNRQPSLKRRALLSLGRENATVDAEDEEEEDGSGEDEWLVARRAERLKYDTDAGLDFPMADEPVLVDDFDLQYLLRRVKLFKPNDLEQLSVDSSYLDEAFKYVAQDPDKHAPPPVVVGRPPPRPPLQMAPTQAVANTQLAQAAAAAAAAAASGQAANPNAAAYAQAQAQQQMAAQQALRMAQQQAAMRKQQQNQQAAAMAVAAAAGAGATGPPDHMRRTPSTQGSPHGSHSPLANGLALQPGPNGQYAMNGVSIPTNYQVPPSPLGANGLPLPRGVVPNGMPLNNGANGVPATSRLSVPPFSNAQAVHYAMQQQQQAQMQGRALSSNGGGGPPSRPASAASSSNANGLSPHLGGMTALPPNGHALGHGGGGALSPATLRANGIATPPTPVAGKRASPIGSVGTGGGYPLQVGQVKQGPGNGSGLGPSPGGQPMPPQYGGFVQG